MQRFDARAAAALEAGVAAVEQASALEVVVRVVPWSGSYRDLGWRAALGAAFVTLLVVLFAPFVVDAAWVPPIVAGAAGLGGLTVRVPALARWQGGRHRLEAQVRRAALACFHEEAVGATRDRTGVLVFASVLEDRALTVRDHALEGRAPLAEWGRIDQLGRPDGRDLPTRLHDMLGALAALGPRVAPRQGDEANELPDAPRIG